MILKTGGEYKPDFPKAPHFNSIRLAWQENGKSIRAIYSKRGYKELFVKKINLLSQEVTQLYHEKSATNIAFKQVSTTLLDSLGIIILSSEQSGWNQLYLLDWNTGDFQPLTTGEFVVKNILHVNRESQDVFFTASGMENSRNPYHNYLYKINLNKRQIQPLTPEEGHHNIRFSPNGKYFMDDNSSAHKPTNSLLRSTEDGSILLEVSTADLTDLYNLGWKPPEIFVTKSYDDSTNIYAALWKPSNFDSKKKYPIIDFSYTGPHTFVFQNTINRAISSTCQSLAELGFIVIRIDSEGGSGRSKAFQNYSYKNLGGNLKGHVLAINHLARKYSWIDSRRVGIFGHSAGGYDAAHGLLAYPDFYKAGVASSADHDHRMEKAWWPEMYMGWPVDSAYHVQSNVTMAQNLKGKLIDHSCRYR